MYFIIAIADDNVFLRKKGIKVITYETYEAATAEITDPNTEHVVSSEQLDVVKVLLDILREDITVGLSDSLVERIITNIRKRFPSDFTEAIIDKKLGIS